MHDQEKPSQPTESSDKNIEQTAPAPPSNSTQSGENVSSPQASAPEPAEEKTTSPVRPVSRPSQQVSQYRAVFHIEVEKIAPNPQQPRRYFDEESLRELAASIREFGMLQPLVVTKVEREVPNGTEVSYELIAGERRLKASKLLGLERVPAVVRTVTVERERLELAIIENLQRENLNPIEMARAYSRLQDEFRMTQREVASRLGKSREVVANTMRLLDLPTEIQDAIARGVISESHGRLLLAIEEPALQEKMFRDLLERHMTIRELREHLLRARPKKEPLPGDPSAEAQAIEPELQSLQRKLSDVFGAPVKISSAGEGGKITINFYSKEELEGILQRLQAEEGL